MRWHPRGGGGGLVDFDWVGQKNKKEQINIWWKMKVSRMRARERRTRLKGDEPSQWCWRETAVKCDEAVFLFVVVCLGFHLPVSLFENETLLFDPGPPALGTHPFTRIHHCGGERYEEDGRDSNRSVSAFQHLYDQNVLTASSDGLERF